MLQVLQLVVPLFGIVFLGFVSARFGKLPLEGLAWLNFLVIYIALPAMFYRLLSQTPVSEFYSFAFIGATTLSTFTVFSGMFLVGLWRNHGNIAEATIQGFAGAYGNIGYMGPPLALAAFGPSAGVPVALVFCFDNALHFTIAPLLMALHSRQQSSVAAMTALILRRIFLHPFILATIAGIIAAVFEFDLPSAADRLLESLALAAAPCALFAMGVTAALRRLKKVPLELAWILPAKLLVAPALLMLLLALLAPSSPPVWVEAAVLMAALPCATNVFVIAQQYGVWQERASSAVVISTALSVVSVTLVLYLAKSGQIALWFARLSQ